MAEYEARADEFEETHTAHILVDKNSLAIAQEISDQLNAAPPGKVEDLFAKLAEKESTDTASAEQGGDLGYNRAGSFVPEFEDAVADMDEGEISGPVESEFGFHVIRLIDRRTVPFEEVRDELDEEISGTAEDEAWQAWIEDAYRAADVRINPRFGELDLSSGQILDAGVEDVPGAEAPIEETPAVGEITFARAVARRCLCWSYHSLPKRPTPSPSGSGTSSSDARASCSSGATTR